MMSDKNTKEIYENFISSIDSNLLNGIKKQKQKNKIIILFCVCLCVYILFSLTDIGYIINNFFNVEICNVYIALLFTIIIPLLYLKVQSNKNKLLKYEKNIQSAMFEKVFGIAVHCKIASDDDYNGLTMKQYLKGDFKWEGHYYYGLPKKEYIDSGFKWKEHYYYEEGFEKLVVPIKNKVIEIFRISVTKNLSNDGIDTFYFLGYISKYKIDVSLSENIYDYDKVINAFNSHSNLKIKTDDIIFRIYNGYLYIMFKNINVFSYNILDYETFSKIYYDILLMIEINKFIGEYLINSNI